MANQQSAPIPVIPQPRNVEFISGKIKLDNTTEIIVSNTATTSDIFSAGLIQQKVNELGGLSLQVINSNQVNLASPAKSKSIKILLGNPDQWSELDTELKSRGLNLSPELGNEGYLLHIDSQKIHIIGTTDRGIFYGVQTLLQLMKKKGGNIYLPQVIIQDYPLFKIRGISDDISRGQISTLADFKKIIRQLAAYKINFYLPYIEDMFSFDKYPEIGLGRGALSKDEVRELVAYAKQYHIEIVPIFQCLGHQERLLAIPRLNHLAENPDKPWCFASVVEEVYPFLTDLIRELVEVFPAPYFCIGCDETYDLGSGKSKELATQIGKDGLFAQHVVKVKQIVEQHGKQVWMYADMPFSPEYPNLLDKLPKDIVMINWIYLTATDYRRAHAIQDSGYPQIVSPATHSHGRIFPDFEEANSNVDHLLYAGYKTGAIGAIQSSWSDFGGESYREFNWYSYAYSADAGWNPDKLHRDWFDRVYFPQFYGTKDKAVQNLHGKLSQSNRGFKWYYGNTAVVLFLDQMDRRPSILVSNREKKAKQLAKLVADCDKLIMQTEKTVTRHQEHLALFKLAIQRIKLLSMRLQTPIKFDTALNEFENPNLSIATKIKSLEQFIAFVNEQKQLLDQTKPEFERLWLNYYKRPMLDINLERYDQLQSYLDGLIFDADGFISYLKHWLT
jgi:hexosaminidase